MFKRLFYALNNNKQFSRKVQVLYYLSSVHSSVSIIELAEHVECSIPTLRSDIRELNEELPPYMRVESLGKNGYFLSYPEGLSIPKITMELAKNTDVYKIIDGLFHNEIYTFDELTYNLFISPFTLKRTLSHINEELKQFNISLSTSTVEFKGGESDIRYFFYAFYSDFNDLTVTDPDYETNSPTYQLLLETASNYNGKKLHLNYFRTTLWFMILKQRLSTQNTLTIKTPYSIESKSLDNYQGFKTCVQQAFSDQFNLDDVSEDEIRWLYLIMLHCVSYSELNYETFVFHREVTDDFLKRVDNFLSLEFDASIMSSAYIENMRSFLINLRSLSQISPSFQKLSLATRIFTKESINKFYLTWMEHLKTKHAQDMFEITNTQDVASALAMLHFSLLSHLKQNEVKILFSFQGEPGYDDFLIQATYFMIPHSTKPQYIFNEPITFEKIKDNQIDLVVANYDIPNSEDIPCPVVRLSYIPNLAEWTHLRNLILDIATHKS